MGGSAWVAWVAIVVLVSGCAAENEEAPAGSVATSPLPTSSGAGDPLTASAPALSVGMGWTYATGGVWDQVPSVTIVVAEAGPNGFLFGAQNERMLEDEIAWDLPYLGRFDSALRSQRDDKYGAGIARNPLLDFPLEAGKTWTFYDVRVTAEPADVAVLGSTEAGWRITGEDAKRSVRIEYAPSVGFVTLFEEVSKPSGKALWSLRLAERHESLPWVWIKRNAEVVDDGVPEQPSLLAVTAQDETVFVWATGTAGSRGIVAPPSGPPLHFETEGGSRVRTMTLPAQAGTWVVSGVAGGPDGSIYTQAHAIDWIRSTD